MAKQFQAWPELGTLRTKLDNEGQRKSYIVLNKNIEILVDGNPLDLGQFRTVRLTDPRKGLDTRLSKGSLTEDDYNEKITALEERNIKYTLVVPPND